MGSRRRVLGSRRWLSAFVVFSAVAGGLSPVAADPPPRDDPPVVPDWAKELAKGDRPDDFVSPGTEPAESAPEIQSTPLKSEPPAVTLPRPGTAEVTLADRGTARRAGESPVRLSAAGSESVGSRLRVEVLDQKAAERAGVRGFAFRLSDAAGQPGVAGERPVTMSVDYGSFADLYGGGYSDRLRVVALPACAVADPVPPDCDRVGEPLHTRDDQANQRLVVDVEDLAAVQDLTVAPPPAAPSTTTTTTAPPSTSTSTTSSTTSTTTSPDAEGAPAESGIDVEPASLVGPVEAAALAQAGGGVVLAVSSGPESEEGSFTATPFTMSGDWQVGVGSGEFSWSYNFPVVAPPAGAAPELSLGYSSGAVDGIVSSKNTQPGNVGLGWGDFANAFIERRYNPCTQDGVMELGDLCWVEQNASISLNGQSSLLVPEPGQDPDNIRNWHLQSDPRWRVERLTVADWEHINNGDNDGEHWKVSTPDGTQYWFGINTDPDGYDPGQTPFTTSSTWTVPVVGDDAGEPCNTSPTDHVANLCTQAWRWNLDRVVDPNGNERWYQYIKEQNAYKAVNGADGHGGDEYTRGGYLERIWYGTYNGNGDYAASILFDVNYRCNTLDAPGTPACVHPQDAPAGMTFPDTPLDLQCNSSDCLHTSPTFWAKQRYTAVHVCVNGLTAGRGRCEVVDSFKLTHRFSNTAEEESDGEKLFLSGIQRTGHDPGATADPGDDVTLTLPPTTFEPVSLANRHLPGTGESAMRHWRIGQVVDEFGREVNVTYGQPHPCPTPAPVYWDNNTANCFPQAWAPEGETPTDRPFNKWLVTQVEVKARNGDTPAGSSPPMVTKYLYGDQVNTQAGAPESWNASRDQAGAAWHHDNDLFTAQAFQTWSDWRGYHDVLVVQGASRTRYKVYRGMNGDLFKEPFPGGFRTVNLASLDGTVTNTPDENWLAGRILDQASLRPDGSEETGTVHGYLSILTADAQPSTNPVDDAHWVAENDTVTRHRTPASGFVYRRKRTQVTYNGLLTFPEQVIEHGWTDDPDDNRCTRTEYVWNISASTFMLDYPQRVTRYDNGTSCSGTAVSRTETAYDGGAVGAAPTKGNPTTGRVQISSAPSPNGTWSVTTTTYDRFGRASSVTDPNNHTTSTVHGDGNDQMGYPGRVRVTNALGHEIETEFVFGRNLPAWSEDANDKRTTYAYDALGRASKVWQPTEPATGPASWQFAYDIDSERDEVPVVQSRQLQDLNGVNGSPRYLDTWAIYDSLLRERQTHTRSPDMSKTIVSDTSYDERGLVNLVNVPEAVTGTPGNALLAAPADGWRNYSQTTYDHKGRPFWELRWADDGDVDLMANNLQSLNASAYTHETVEVDPAVGNAGNTRTTTDGLGRTIEVAEQDDSAYRTTSYAYDTADQLTSVTDPANNKLSYTYDMAGRRTAMDDPDAGDWTYTYDPAGNQTAVTDALNAVVHIKHDELNRPIERRRDNPITGQVLVTWAYDAPGEAGLLDSSTRVTPTGNWVVDVAGYDSRDRPTGRIWIAPPGITGLTGSYAVSYGYDKADHKTSVGSPAIGGLSAETVTTTYDAFGLPDAMDGLSEYVSISNYDNRGRSSIFSFGSGTVNAIGKFWQYDLNQRLGLQQTSTPGGLTQDRSIAYDPAGNVTERNTTLSGASFRECLGYDPRNRLVSAYTTAPANTCASGSGKGTGADPYNHTYAYTHDGNLESRIEGGTPVNYTYPTSGPTSTRPHAPTQVGSNSYIWNPNGNLLSRTVGGQTDQFTWDAEHRLASVAGASGDNTFVYDADGNRLLRRTPDGVTLYIEGHEISVLTGQATATAVRSYAFGGAPAAIRTQAGIDFLIVDNQGSVEQTIPVGSPTAAVSRTYYPYGKVRTGGQPATDHGWIGQIEDDSTGLHYLNSRYYDASAAVFTAPDPLAARDRPTTFNPYQYALLNPLSSSDPSGEGVIPDGGNWKGSGIYGPGSATPALVITYHTEAIDAAPTNVDIALAFWEAGGGLEGVLKVGNRFGGLCDQYEPDPSRGCISRAVVLTADDLAFGAALNEQFKAGQARARREAVGLILSVAPVTGDLLDLKDAISSALDGDWTGATLSTAGVVAPVVGARGMTRFADELAAGVRASKHNYRKLFRAAHPEMSSDYAVHHALPQKYRATMAAEGINIDENQFLRGVDPTIHSKITTEWSRWDRSLDHAASAEEIAAFSYKIDEKYGDDFIFG